MPCPEPGLHGGRQIISRCSVALRAAAWPLTARAQQQAERLRRVGVLMDQALGPTAPTSHRFPASCSGSTLSIAYGGAAPCHNSYVRT